MPLGQDGGGPIGLFLADAGYCSGHNLTIPGPDRLIATGKTRDLKKAALDPALAVAPWHSEAIAAMAVRLATAEGITAYRQRSHIAETPHGQIKHNMRFRQLSLRGHAKAAAEWTFTCAVHNLFKAITTGHLTTTTLAGLPGQAALPRNPSDFGAFMSPLSQAPKLSCSNPWRLNASYGRLRLDTLTATPDWSHGFGGG